jgi:large subunit ribosomal protein L31
MKKGIHPSYHEITLQFTDGTTLKTRSTYGKPGEVIKLGIDPKTHPAWTKGEQRLVSDGQLTRFSKRFGNFGLGE